MDLDKALAALRVVAGQIPYVLKYEGERSYRLAKMEAVFDKSDVVRLSKLVKSEHNTYGMVDELKRLDIIWSLACKGFSFPQIYRWVERQQERDVMLLLECGFRIGEINENRI